jgi:mannitol PTS system EIICBA or EIICB component
VLERIQRYGGFLAGMVIPNIGAILAWGLITAFFIPTGWIPNENIAKVVGPMITYMLPILIGYTGGKLVYGHRGGVIGAVMTTGVIVGAGVVMFLGAMIAGPLAAWLLKKLDEQLAERVPSGFEMLYNNFSSGILGPRWRSSASSRSAPSSRRRQMRSARSCKPSSMPACSRSQTSRSRSPRSCS